ncbi:MAG: Wzz/FepE/Etk N-terminal domain-containing protein [Gammaproteobacteria bacterium]
MTELALEQTPDFGDYLAAFRRRRGLIGLVAGLILLLGLITAFVWPPTYQASATILIEEQEIPTDLIQSTVTSYAAQRIQVISQRVMSRTNLLEIIEKYNLFERDRRLNTIEQVLLDMREDIHIDMINAEVMDPRTGRPTAATIAFTLGFDSDSPQQALQVTNELTTLYLDENQKSRTEKAAETTDFLTIEADRLKAEIVRLESALARFKEQNINTLPELRDLNTQILERTGSEISNVETQIRDLTERQIYLQGQLALMEPYGSGDALSTPARLEALRTEYIHLASRYSPDHPDVTRAKREIRALEKETGQTASAFELQEQLRALREQLASAEESYTDEHPDVKSLRRQVAGLESEIRQVSASPKVSLPTATPDNPAYVNLKTQLAAANSEIGSLRAKRAELVTKVADYEARLMQTPKSEQEYRAIARDLDNASARYQEISAKQMTAEVAQEMEKERKSEKFTLIDPAILPEEPVSPNRPAIIFLSLVLALGAGMGSAAVTESLDNAIRGVKSVVATVQTAPLAVIPYLSNQVESGRQKRQRVIIVVVALSIIILVLAMVHFLVSPLDVLWFRSLRKVDSLIAE